MRFQTDKFGFNRKVLRGHITVNKVLTLADSCKRNSCFSGPLKGSFVTLVRRSTRREVTIEGSYPKKAINYLPKKGLMQNKKLNNLVNFQLIFMTGTVL